jgi:hypothetical protein
MAKTTAPVKAPLQTALNSAASATYERPSGAIYAWFLIEAGAI